MRSYQWVLNIAYTLAQVELSEYEILWSKDNYVVETHATIAALRKSNNKKADEFSYKNDVK